MVLVKVLDTLTLAISVSDRRSSALWYQKIFGLDLIHHMDEAGLSELKTKISNVTIGLEEGNSGSGTVTPVFGVADVELARADLSAACVTFIGPAQVVEGMVITATMFGPDGNPIIPAQELGS